MKKSIVASIVLASFVVVSPVQAKAVTHQHARQYESTRHQVVKLLGTRAPGRDIVKWGLSNGHRATDSQVVQSWNVLRRMLAPSPMIAPARAPTVPTLATPTSYASPQTAYAPSYSGGSSALPTCTWQGESGGNWNAVNPSSGAYGMYQIMPGTAAGYGCNLSTHAGQTACAQVILQRQGLGAWTACG